KDSAEVMVMNADGSHIINLTHDGKEQRSPSWSVSGRVIYYKTRNDTTTSFHSLNILTHETKIICNVAGTIFGFSVSPDGNHIVYAAKRENVSSVYLYDVKSKTEKLFFSE